MVATFYVIVHDIPEKVRLPAAATWTRRAGRAALAEAEAIWAASLDASTRVEAIVSEGGVVLEDRKMARKRLTRKDDGVETACVREEERGGKGREGGRTKWSACGTEARPGPGNGPKLPDKRYHWPMASRRRHLRDHSTGARSVWV